MKVSVIVAVYKDVEALSLIVDALKNQTYKNIEVVVAEDGESQEMSEYLDSVEGINVIHTTQKDSGIRKSRSQNNGILASTGDYLIFIDGDCIPFSRFVAGHVKLANVDHVLTGRRVNLGVRYSLSLRNRTLDSQKLERKFIWSYLSISKDENASHIEQGLMVKPNGFIYNAFISRGKKGILGCNFSLFKDRMIAINGFDESYENTSIGDDVDLSWRFKAAGLEEKSCKHVANIFHLDHGRDHHAKNTETERDLMQQRIDANQYVTKNGLNTH